MTDNDKVQLVEALTRAIAQLFLTIVAAWIACYGVWHIAHAQEPFDFLIAGLLEVIAGWTLHRVYNHWLPPKRH